MNTFNDSPLTLKIKYDPAKKTFTSRFEVDAGEGAKMSMKQVVTRIDAQSRKLEQFLLLEGDEVKLMKILYVKRAKSK